MANENGVLVFAEAAEGGGLAAISLELLGAARRLGEQLGQPVSAAILGQGGESLAQELIAGGADKVYVVDDALLSTYQGDPYLPAAVKVCQEANPAVVLLPQTMTGRDLTPRLAHRLGTAAVMDCIELKVKDGRVVMTRPCYGGHANADYTCKAMPQMATGRGKAQEPLPPDSSRKGDVVKVAAGVDASAVRAKLVERRKEAAAGVPLEDAEAGGCGGRGMGSPEAFKELEDLATILGGATGATRAACDLGWYPVPQQIGLTGKIVSPTLYIAIALSGASQHMAGVSGAKTIVAINKDPEANIFRFCRYGVVADWKAVLPALKEKVRQLKAQ